MTTAKNPSASGPPAYIVRSYSIYLYAAIRTNKNAVSWVRRSLGETNRDGRPQLGAKKEGEHVKPPKIPVETLYLLYMVLFMTMWMSSLRWSQHVESRRYGPAVEALITCFFFTFVTVLLQALLAVALSEKPAPSVLPPPVNQWIMGITVWMFGVLYYVIYADMVWMSSAEPSCRDLIIAGVASVVSLAMTVYNMLPRPVFA